jgi:hypothetical protein
MADEQLEYGFSTAVFVLDHTVGKLEVAEAERTWSEVNKENFWRMWPEIREWAEALYQRIDDERRHSSSPVQDEEWDEVGGSG